MKFTATEVSAEVGEFDILMIFFGNEENYLMIQFEEHPPEGEVSFGPYHIERDDQSYGGYGGVQSWQLTSNSLVVELDETGKSHLQTDRVEVDFEIDEDLLKQVEKSLKLALG